MNKQKFKSIILEFVSRFKTFPTTTWLEKKTGLEKVVVQTFLKEMIVSGEIVRRGQSFQVKEIRREKKELKAKKIKPLQLFFKYFNAVFIIRVVMFCISLVAIYISIHYSYLWIAEFLEPFKALLLAVAMVTYVTFALEAVFILFKAHTVTGGIMGFIILITALAALVFSMSMTVIGQYNKKTELLSIVSENKQAGIKEVAKLDILKDSVNSAAEAVKTKREEIKINQEILAGFEKEDTETTEYKVQLWKLSVLNREVREYEAAVAKARADLKTFLETEETTTQIIERSDFYIWFADLIGAESGVVEFVLYLIPALFVDIIAPLGMFVALGLYRKKKKGKKK